MKKILVLFTILTMNIWALDVTSPMAPPSVPLFGINDINVHLVQDVSTEMIPSIIKGKEGIYVLPINVGAKLYAKGIKIKFLGTTSNGLLSFVSTKAKTFSDLNNQPLYIGGQGSSPDVITKSILTKEKVDAKITYRSSPEIAKLMITGKIENAILPEPLATMVLSKNKNAVRVVELKDLWLDKTMPQVGMFVLDSTLQNQPREIEKFLADYKKSVANISDKEVAEAITKFNLKMTSEEFKSSMKYMNLTLDNNKNEVNNYLEMLGIEVKDDFYAL